MVKSKRTHHVVSAAVMLSLTLGTGTTAAQTVIPTQSDVLTDAFERPTLEDWVIATGSVLGLDPGQGPAGTTALRVTVSQAESHLVRGGRRDLARADEAYLTFQFDPNNLRYSDPVPTGFLPGRSIQIAAIKGPGFKNMVAIRFRDTGSAYEGFIEWRDASDNGQFDFETGSFPIADAWQEITIGFRNDDWVACWINGSLVRSVSGITHLEPYGSVIEVGKTLSNSLINPSGVIRFDDVRFAVPRLGNLWVDAVGGSDLNDGLTPGTALASISRASDFAAAGSTVHIMPGIYRESVLPAQGGQDVDPVIFRAENGPGTVIIRGTARSADLSWTQLTSDTIGLPAGVAPGNIWWTDLSSWALASAPRFVMTTNASGQLLARLPLAREPDWSVLTAWKPSEFWWSATGGSAVAPCTPAPENSDCDLASRSELQLTDAANDATPAGVEPGNLTTLGNLTGAALVALDTGRGHFHYRRTIVSHNVGAGRITVDEPCRRSSPTDPGLGWGTKYYVEGHPGLIDQAGEWWYDTASKRLYLWPPAPGNPSLQQLEIGRYPVGFELKDRSYVTLENLDIEAFNESSVEADNFTWHRSAGVTVRGCLLRYANRGLMFRQQSVAGQHDNKNIERLLIENNDFTRIDTNALLVTSIWENGSAADSWSRSSVFDTTIRGNHVHDLGFNAEALADSTGSVVIRHPDRLTIENNLITDTGPEGILILESVIQSPNMVNVLPAEIMIGKVLIRDNLVERACQLKNDCGGIRIWGPPPDAHIFRDFLLYHNRFQNIIGWGWAAEKRGANSAGQILGAGGNGIYFDNTSGIHSYRNTVYENGNAGFFFTSTWRWGFHFLYNNVVANNMFGFQFGGLFRDTQPNVDTRVRNNILINNEGYGIRFEDLDNDLSNTAIDFNRYDRNGWGSNLPMPGILAIVNNGPQSHFPTLADVQAGTPFETNGLSGDPTFFDYNLADHDPFDDSRPDFRLLTSSPAVDAGTTSLPPTLGSLLGLFGITETKIGPRWDQGAFEGGVPAPPMPIFSDGFESGDTTAWSQTVP